MDEDGVRKVLVAQGRPTDLKFTSQFLEVLGATPSNGHPMAGR